jgi:tetratricopeptide (TPR) repeat protein
VLVNPKYADAYNDLGVILESLGDEANARFSYDRALSIRPDFAAAHTNLALLHEKAGRLEEAAEHWNARIQLGPPNNPWVAGAREKLTQHNLTVLEIPAKRGKSKASLHQPKATLQAKAAVPVKEAPRVSAPSPDAKALAKSLAREKERSAKEKANWQKRQAQLEKASQKQAKRTLREKERDVRSQAKEAKARWKERAIPSRPAAPLKTPVPSDARLRLSEAAPLIPPDALALAKDLAKEKAKTKAGTIQELLRQGKAAMKARRYEEAASSMKGILLLDPNHRKAAQWLREAQEKLARQARPKPVRPKPVRPEPVRPPVKREIPSVPAPPSQEGPVVPLPTAAATALPRQAVVTESREDKLQAEKARAEVQEARRQAEQVKAQVEEARRELDEMRLQMEETRRLQAAPPAVPLEASAPPMTAEEARQAVLEKQRRVRELYEQGVDQMRRGLFEEAQASFQEILTLDPRHEEARQGLQRAQKVLTKAGKI